MNRDPSKLNDPVINSKLTVKPLRPATSDGAVWPGYGTDLCRTD